MPTHGTHISCGVQQYYAISNFWTNSGDRLRDMLLDLGNINAAMCGTVVWSDADMLGNGKALEQQIKAAFPDTQIVSVTARNPNSGNMIETWLWTPDWKQVEDYARANKITGLTRFKQIHTAQGRY
jgi:hypothetical protein